MKSPDPLSVGLGVILGAGATVGMVWLLAGDGRLPREATRDLQPPAAEPMEEGDRAFTPADGNRGRRAAPEPAEDEQAPAADPAESASAAPYDLQTAKKIHFHQMSERQLLDVFGEGVRVRDLATAGKAAEELKKRFKDTEIPYPLVRPEMERAKAHRGVVHAAVVTWKAKTLVAALERAATSAGTPADRPDWLFVGQFAGSAINRRASVPRWVVTRLVEHENATIHWAGLILARAGKGVDPAAVTRRLSDPAAHVRAAAALAWTTLGRRRDVTIPASKLRALAFDDPDRNVRRSAMGTISELAWNARMDLPGEELLNAAQEDADTSVRSVAIWALARHLQGDTRMPRARATEFILTAARGDKDPAVREAAIENLEVLGAAGADVAIELLDTPGFMASNDVDSAVWAAVRGGRGADVLSRRTSPYVAGQALGALRSFDEDEHPNALRDLVPSIGPLLAWRELYTDAEAVESATDLMETLVRARITEPVIQVAMDGQVPLEIRRRAVGELIVREETYATGYSLATRLLRDTTTHAEFRMSLVEDIYDAAREEYADLTVTRAEIERVAKEDASFYVRERAKEFLADLNDLDD